MIEGLKRSKAGFTLVELIVVIAILGILAGISVPVYSGYIAKAREASDLQLVGAVNTAFAAACASHGKNPTEVNATAALDGSGRLTGVTPAALNEDFMRFYGENADKAFQVYKSLGYDKKNGVFVDGAKEVSVPYGGGTVTVTMADVAAYNASIFGDLGTENVLDQVEAVVTAAAASFNEAATNSNLNGTLKAFLKEKYGIDETAFNALSPTEKANALVLMVASNAKNLDAAALVSEYNKNGTIDLSAILSPNTDPGDSSGFAADTATKLTIPYALAMAYVNSDMVKSDILTGVSGGVPIKTYTYNGKTYSLAEWSAFTGDLYDKYWDDDDEEAWALYQQVKDIEPTITYTGEVTYEYGSAYDLFYGGGTLNTLDNGVTTITGTNHMQSYEDAQATVNLITQSDGFKEYMASGQGQSDLEGFISAMNMLDANAGKVSTTDLLKNGFGDESLQAMIASVLGN